LAWNAKRHGVTRRGFDVIVFKTHKLLEKLAPDLSSAQDVNKPRSKACGGGFDRSP
jgi:hypothetical protein